MRVLRILTVLGLVGLLVMACSEKPENTIGQTETDKKMIPITQAEESDEQASARLAESTPGVPAEIDGTLMQTEKGLAVVTATETYVVIGKDLSDMLGKMVKVTGAIAEVDGGQVIEVMTVTPIE